jgi:hypothetical protein
LIIKSHSVSLFQSATLSKTSSGIINPQLTGVYNRI